MFFWFLRPKYETRLSVNSQTRNKLPRSLTPLGEELSPDLEGLFDFFGLAGGGEFPDDGAIAREKRQQGFVVERAGEGCAVIACRPLDVVDVGADDVRGDLLEPIDVVEQADIVLELDVAEVVPITDPGVVFEVVL